MAVMTPDGAKLVIGFPHFVIDCAAPNDGPFRLG
jgi:hypothetical protein